MNYLKDSRGAITLFVLVALMFFIIALVNVSVYLNNKETSVETQYRQIQSSYENQDANEVYTSLAN